MPANLNALIRYKTIDRCLRNKYIRFDIRRLQEACSEALGEARGRREQVSERTIREDIRVMRSEILEFNAPILCEEGYYRYSDPAYSIFNVSLSNKDIIRQVMAILWTYRSAISHPTLHDIIETLGDIAGIEISELQPLVQEYLDDDIPLEEPLYLKESVDKRKRASESIQKSLVFDDKSESDSDKSVYREPDTMYYHNVPKCSKDLSQPLQPAAFSWGNILRML